MDQIPGPSNRANPAVMPQLAETASARSVPRRKWPTEWRDDFGAPGVNMERFLADTRKREEYWSSLGVPFHRVVTDRDGKVKLLPRQAVGLEEPAAVGLQDTLGKDYIATIRMTPAGRGGDHTTYKMVGNKRRGVDS